MNDERYKKLKNSAQRYTAYRERAPKEVEDKLAEWDAKPEYIERIVSELKQDKFIDEGRFARAFSHDKFLVNKWGKRRIEIELRRYRISGEAIEQGLNYINQEEYQSVLERLAELKWTKVKDNDLYKKKQKTATYLLQKGFESDLIWDVVNELG